MRLIAPQHVKPFLKRGKNDRADAEAISEAASRPSMRFVPVKNAQTQAAAMMQSTRQLLVRQRTALINAMRGHPSEFGLVVGRGTENVAALLAAIAGLPGRKTSTRSTPKVFAANRICGKSSRQRRTPWRGCSKNLPRPGQRPDTGRHAGAPNRYSWRGKRSSQARRARVDWFSAETAEPAARAKRARAGREVTPVLCMIDAR